MTISAISALLGVALGGKIGAAIGAIVAEFFKTGSDYAYYHVVDKMVNICLKISIPEKICR